MTDRSLVLLAPLTMVGVLLLCVGAARADEELCVACANPDTTYRCAVERAGDAMKVRGADRAIQFLCVSELARAGKHSSCKVSRDTPSGFCAGELRVVAADGTVTAPVVARGAPTGRPAPTSEPKTIVEMTQRSIDTSGEQLKSAGAAVKDTAKSAGETVAGAGSAVGRAAKKTWLCVTSLFSSC